MGPFLPPPVRGGSQHPGHLSLGTAKQGEQGGLVGMPCKHCDHVSVQAAKGGVDNPEAVWKCDLFAFSVTRVRLKGQILPQM